MKMKRIIFISNFLSSKNFTKSQSEELSNLLEKEGCFIIRTSNKKNSILKVVNMAYTILLNYKKYDLAIIDLFSQRAFFWAEISAKILKFLKKPFFLVLRGGELPQFSKKYQKKVSKLLYSAKKVIAPSEYLKEEMKIYRDDILYIPNGINLKNYKFRLRNNLEKKFIWIRAFHKTYNPRLAIEAFFKVKKVYPEALLCMIGPDKKDGSLEDVKNFIYEKNLEKDVEIIKGVEKEKIPEYLKYYDIFLNTTNVDNTPVTVIEAMACGLCVVSTNVGGIPYLLKDKEDSLLVSKGKADQMARAIISLLEDPALCQTLSKNARQKAESFSWEKILSFWKEVINE